MRGDKEMCLHKYIEERPWGRFEQFFTNTNCTVKILILEAGQALSLQYHNFRDEFWRVLQGNGTFIIDEGEKLGRKDDEFFIPRMTHHRIIAGENGVEVLEIAFGEFDEQDIVRIEDRYSRA